MTSLAAAALEALADEAALEAAADVLAALADAALADADALEALAAELDACWPQPASANTSANANAAPKIERSLEFLFIGFLLCLPTLFLQTNGP